METRLHPSSFLQWAYNIMAPDLWIYFLAVLAVVLLPGMDMAFVMASSLAGGRRGRGGVGHIP